ncbi:MAG: bifunctional oligoribonuclease/PAP phosphatase NrnA [Planctomycetia bacterium]|nr:bifunctional oligoribonuclease/PAP phosphatase NrnA [Planctomycetia bacterium]
MPISWEPFVEVIRRHRHILLTTHVRPDGDGLGSMRGLAETLEQQGKQVRMVVASNYPARYQFLNADGRIERFTLPGDSWQQTEAVVVMDTGTRNQLGDFAAFMDGLSVDKVVIDHHRTQDDLRALTLVDTSAEATGRLAYEAIRALGGRPTPSAADALFTALAMDTGWFRHSNATPKTFALAAELVEAGARPEILYDLLFEQNSLPRLKLMGAVLERIRTDCDGKVAYTELRVQDYVATGALPSDSEDLVNFTRSVTGVEVGLFFMEQPRGGVKVSFRSRARVDVERVAKQFGGGGHRLASGATLETSLDVAQERVLAAVRDAVREINA